MTFCHTLKTPIPLHDKTNIVNCIPCKDCEKCHVGQTLSQRLKEHQRAVRNFDVNASVLVEPVQKEDHRIAGRMHLS